VFNTKQLDRLNHFELLEWQPLEAYKPGQYYVGVHVKVDERRNERRALAEGNVKSVSSVDTFYHQVPSEDVLRLLIGDSKTVKPWNAYAWDKGRIVTIENVGPVRLDRQARVELKEILTHRWKGKPYKDMLKDDGLFLWELFK
jgi:hypothetical protein